MGYVFERIGKPLWVLRPLSLWFAAISLYLNMAAGEDPQSIAGHAAVVTLFIVIVEVCRHAIRKHSREVSYEGVHWWLMKPRTAFSVWRSMRVDRVSYKVALGREYARLYVVSLLRSVKGRRWRAQVPQLLRDQVRSGRLPDTVMAAVDEAVAAGSDTAWEPVVHEYIVRELTRADDLRAALETEADRREQEKVNRPRRGRESGQAAVAASGGPAAAPSQALEAAAWPSPNGTAAPEPARRGRLRAATLRPQPPRDQAAAEPDDVIGALMHAYRHARAGGLAEVDALLAGRSDYDAIVGALDRGNASKRLKILVAFYAVGRLSQAAARKWVAGHIDGKGGLVDKSETRIVARQLAPFWAPERNTAKRDVWPHAPVAPATHVETAQ